MSLLPDLSVALLAPIPSRLWLLYRLFFVPKSQVQPCELLLVHLVGVLVNLDRVCIVMLLIYYNFVVVVT